MTKLCERPGCSEPGAAAYGMVPEDLLFWIAPLRDAPGADPSVLCLRHADAMVVPRGWTLDDLRDETPRLFKSPSVDRARKPKRPRTRHARSTDGDPHQQLQIDGTGEITRPPDDRIGATDDPDRSDGVGHEPWQPDFDAGDNLDGLLEVRSPLLARAFRGTDRPKR